jgi:hypothetical protein
MNMPTQRQWRIIYDRVAPVLVVICLLASLFASVGTFFLARVNEAQDRQSDADKALLLKCFDRYAELQSASSVAVREASVVKDRRTAERDDALNAEGEAFKDLVEAALTGEGIPPELVQRLSETLHDRADAARQLDRAQAALDKAREDNPIPPAPSEFCSVQP